MSNETSWSERSLAWSADLAATLAPWLILAGLTGCAEPTASGTQPHDAPEAAPSASVVIPSPPASGSASSVASVGAPTPREPIEFEALLKELNQQTGGGMRGRLSTEGLVLRRLDPHGALSRLGLRDGDVVVTLNDLAFVEPEEIVNATVAAMRSRRFDVRARRGNAEQTFSLGATDP